MGMKSGMFSIEQQRVFLAVSKSMEELKNGSFRAARQFTLQFLHDNRSIYSCCTYLRRLVRHIALIRVRFRCLSTRQGKNGLLCKCAIAESTYTAMQIGPLLEVVHVTVFWRVCTGDAKLHFVVIPISLLRGRVDSAERWV